MSLPRLWALTAMALASWPVATGCLNMDPLLQKELPLEAGSDALSDAPALDGAWRTACHECIKTAPDCSYAACGADPRCVAFDECIIELGCLAYRDLDSRIACGQPCFKRVGILDFTDPSLLLYQYVNGCTTYPVAGSTENGGPCAAECVLW